MRRKKPKSPSPNPLDFKFIDSLVYIPFHVTDLTGETVCFKIFTKQREKGLFLGNVREFNVDLVFTSESLKSLLSTFLRKIRSRMEPVRKKEPVWTQLLTKSFLSHL